MVWVNSCLSCYGNSNPNVTINIIRLVYVIRYLEKKGHVGRMVLYVMSILNKSYSSPSRDGEDRHN